MSPFGPQGYGDYQRIQNWDSEPVLENITTKHTGLFQTGALACSRYSSLMGTINVVTSSVQVALEYFTDQALTKPCGKQVLVCNPNTQFGAQMHYPCLGPWLRISFQPKEEAESYTLTARLFLTNRDHPLMLIPVTAVLVDKTQNVGGGGGEVAAWSTSQYSGPLRIKGFAPAVNWTIWLQAETSPGIQRVLEVLNGGPSENKEVTTIAPATAWQLTLINTSAGEGEVSAQGWPSFSGSS